LKEAIKEGDYDSSNKGHADGRKGLSRLRNEKRHYRVEGTRG
jgi:hypothetical protein